MYTQTGSASATVFLNLVGAMAAGGRQLSVQSRKPTSTRQVWVQASCKKLPESTLVLQSLSCHNNPLSYSIAFLCLFPLLSHGLHVLHPSFLPLSLHSFRCLYIYLCLYASMYPLMFVCVVKMKEDKISNNCTCYKLSLMF